MRPLLKLSEELVVDVGNQGEVALGAARHELADHCLVVVLRHKAANHEVVALGRKPVLGTPASKIRGVVRKRAPMCIRTVSDKLSGRSIGRRIVLLVDVPLDVLRVADQQIAIADHHGLGGLPVAAHGGAPLGALPLVPVWVHVKSSTQSVDTLLEVGAEGPDAARQDVNNRVLDVVVLDVAADAAERRNVVQDCLGGSHVGNLHVEAAGAVILELAILAGLASHMVPDARVALVRLGQPVDKGLVATVIARNALRAYNEDVLCFRH